MTIRNAIASYFEQTSQFQINGAALDVNAQSVEPLRPYSGKLILWPLVNTPASVHKLLWALKAEIVPIVCPDLPSGQLARIRNRYPKLGLFDGVQFDPQGDIGDAPTDVFVGILTSGSTGAPKIIVTTEQRLATGVRAIHQAQQLDFNQISYATLPVAYSFAFVNQLMWALIYQRQLVLSIGMHSPLDFFERVRTTQSDMLCFVASQFRQLQQVGLQTVAPLPLVTRVNFGGAPFPVEVYDDLRHLFPNAKMFNNYGCTEAMPRVALTEVFSSRHPISKVGLPIGDLKLRIAAEEKVGPIEFSGTSTAQGILLPNLTVASFGEWIASGDEGYLERNGTLHVMGRHDQVVKIDGARISLVEIEQQLIGLGAQYAAAWKDASNEQVTAVVKGISRRALKSLRQSLRDQLPRAAWPRTLLGVNTWPTLANGKTDRAYLQQQAKEKSLEQLW